MADQITRWFPDTCNCVIDYQWDDSVSSEERVHTTVKYEPCPIHANETLETIFAVVLNENQTKNQVLALIKEENPTIDIEQIAFKFDDDRHLNLYLSGLTNIQVNFIQLAIDREYEGITFNGHSITNS